MKPIQKQTSPGKFITYLVMLSSIDLVLLLVYLADNFVFQHYHEGTNEYFILNNILILIFFLAEWFIYVAAFITYPLKHLMISSSIIWINVLAVERFFAIVHPFQIE